MRMDHDDRWLGLEAKVIGKGQRSKRGRCDLDWAVLDFNLRTIELTELINVLIKIYNTSYNSLYLTFTCT